MPKRLKRTVCRTSSGPTLSLIKCYRFFFIFVIPMLGFSLPKQGAAVLQKGNYRQWG